MKAVGTINRRPIDIFKTIGNINYRKDYDPTYDDGHPFERIAD
jgi:hypothetical protein